jgi:diguanylate cyclase (GGDEF)-like protein
VGLSVRTLAEGVVDGTSMGLLATDAVGRLVWANRVARQLLEAAGDGADGGVPGLPLEHAPPGAGPCEISWRGANGRHRWLEVSCRRFVPDGDIAALLLYEVADITARRNEIDRARNREWRLTRIEALARVGTWEWDLTTDKVTWSDELLKMFGYPLETELDYPTYRALLHPDDIGLIEDTLAEALRTAMPFSYTHRMYLPDRVTLRIFECYGEVFTDAAGRPVRMLGTAHDITNVRRTQDELAFLADHDPLTGLANRRAISSCLREPVAGGALLLIDVDNFKDINDLRGHAVGDEVMRSLATLLREQLCPRAVLGRIGGDEFAVVVAEGDAGHALTAADSLCDVVAGTPVFAGGAALHVTVSIGVAPRGPDDDCDVLFAHADLALYEAKNAGRNRARLFAPEQYHLAAHRVSALRRVHDALARGVMALDAQPIIDLATGAVSRYELLVRLRDGQRPALMPAEFLPAVERTDLILRLDRWVIERAVAALAAPSAQHAGLRLDINISGRSLEDATLGDWILGLLRRADVDPSRLGLEITETAAITSLEAARRLADRVTSAGCRFTLDDFGAGFGSFVYLKHLPFSAVKIAGEFVRQLDHEAADAVMVDAVVRVARGLDMTTIAEYVDREPLVATLRELGVDCGQGYHLGRPSPLEEILERT